MVVLITCKNDEDPIKIKALEWSHYSLIFRRSGAAYSVVHEQILAKFKLILAFIVFLLPARMKKIHSKMKTLVVTFLLY